MRLGVLGLALGLSACSDGAAFWSWPDLPPTTQSIILAADRDTGFEVQALSWGLDRDPGPVELDASGVSSLAVLAYDASLEERGLPPGPLSLVGEGECVSRALVPADTLFARSVDEETWTPSAPSPKVQAARVLARCPCRGFDLIRDLSFDLSLTGNVEVFELDDALYVLSKPGSLRLELSGTSTGTILSPNPLTLTAPPYLTVAPEDHWIAPDGQVWFGGSTRDAPVIRWDPGSAQTSLIRAAGVRCSGVSGAPAGFDPEIYVACESAVTERFDGTDWTRLDADSVRDDPDQTGRVAWLASGRAVTSLHDSAHLGFVRQGRMASVVERGDVTSIERWIVTEAFGALAGTKLGEVASLEGEQLRPLARLRDDPGNDGTITQMWEQDEAVLYVTREGHIGQVRSGPLVCIPEAVGGFVQVFGGIGRDDRVWLVGADPLGLLRVAELKLTDMATEPR